MGATVNIYSKIENEIYRFLNSFDNEKNVKIKKMLKWEKTYLNPVEMADIIGVFIDNKEKYRINMWVSLDKDFFINITDNNADQIIRYLYERYPY